MKYLPTIIALAAVAALLLVGCAAVVGVSSPSWSLAARVAGFAWAAGAIGLFLADYAPRHSYGDRTAVRVPAAQAVVSPRRMIPAQARPAADGTPAGAMVTLGLSNDPATVSLM